MANDAVNREDVMALLREAYRGTRIGQAKQVLIELAEQIKRLPPAQTEAEDEASGRWEQVSYNEAGVNWRCSVCGKTVNVRFQRDPAEEWRYCPGCWARMTAGE